MDAETKKLVESVLKSFIQFSDEILPKAAKLCFDIGNLNDGLIDARRLQDVLYKAD